MRKSRIANLFLVLSVFFLVWTLIHITMRLVHPSIVFNYEFISVLPSIILLIATFGLFSFIYLMIISANKNIRAVLSLVACFGFLLFSFLAIMETEDIGKLQHDDGVIYISRYSFLFDGHDSFYQKENFFYSHWISNADQHDDASSTYYVEDNMLFIKTSWHDSHNEYLIEINLDD